MSPKFLPHYFIILLTSSNTASDRDLSFPYVTHSLVELIRSSAVVALNCADTQGDVWRLVPEKTTLLCPWDFFPGWNKLIFFMRPLKIRFLDLLIPRMWRQGLGLQTSLSGSNPTLLVCSYLGVPFWAFLNPRPICHLGLLWNLILTQYPAHTFPIWFLTAAAPPCCKHFCYTWSPHMCLFH